MKNITNPTNKTSLLTKMMFFDKFIIYEYENIKQDN